MGKRTGGKAQSALEHAYKAVIAVHERAFPQTHTLEFLHRNVRNLVPNTTVVVEVP